MKITSRFIILLLLIPAVILVFTNMIIYTIQTNVVRNEIILQQKFMVQEITNGLDK